MAEALGMFEFPQTSSSKSIPSILNRKRKTQSKTFMVSNQFGPFEVLRQIHKVSLTLYNFIHSFFRLKTKKISMKITSNLPNRQ